ncbi:hypothetical protein TWF696_003130 [Orbilia brochopaga]|uniref:Uncharacterized protein n=1 Tax=Orbilia brochopaga TaxID=3140254 RepID=A0AAV9U1Q5_9PEZI
MHTYMETIQRAADDAARSVAPPESLDVSGVVDVGELADLPAVAKEIIELQKAADGTLEACRQLLAKLYVYEYVRSLQGADADADSGTKAATECTEELVASLCAIRPTVDVWEEVEGDDGDGFNEVKPTPNLTIFTATVSLCLTILDGQLTASPDLLSSASLRAAVAAALAVYGDPSAVWATSANAAAVERIRSANSVSLMTTETLTDLLLSVRRMSAFQRPPGTVTAMGRRAVRVPRVQKDVDVDIESERRRGVEMGEGLAIVRFVVTGMEPSAVQQNWHLIVPAILTALDDGDILTKAHACDVLTCLLGVVDTAFLSRTGLAAVFEEAVTPCLHFLPPLTPVGQARKSFTAGVNALVALGGTKGAGGDEEMYKALDKVLREGVFRAVTYAGENVRMMEVVVDLAAGVVRKLGMRSVRHLKNLVPLCTKPLLSPFVTAYLPLAVCATTTLQEVVRNCWPRVEDYNAVVLEAAVFCWVRVQQSEDEGEEMERLRHELRVLMALLAGANRESGWMKQARQKVEQRGQGLAGLFADVSV